MSRTTVNAYDYGAQGAGDLTLVSLPGGGLLTYAYEHTFHHPTLAVDPPGPPTEDAYDTSTGDLLSATDPRGCVTAHDWSNGLLLSVTDPDRLPTTYPYDADRR